MNRSNLVVACVLLSLSGTVILQTFRVREDDELIKRQTETMRDLTAASQRLRNADDKIEADLMRFSDRCPQ